MELDKATEQIITTSAKIDLSITSLITSSDFISKFIIFLLILASICSWTIIIHKIIQYHLINQRMKSFENLFWSGQVLDELYEKIKLSIEDPLSAVFVEAIKECKKNKNMTNTSDMLRASYKERVIGVMNLARNNAIELLEAKLDFLATVGSSSPFLGLFGTVWGIMHSFQSIASSNNTSLAVVAPGIAEALLVTAIGLFAAIPATIFYNYLSSQVNKIDNKIDNFINEFSILITRAIDENKM